MSIGVIRLNSTSEIKHEHYIPVIKIY